jgi:hypothetical protein
VGLWIGVLHIHVDRRPYGDTIWTYRSGSSTSSPTNDDSAESATN